MFDDSPTKKAALSGALSGSILGGGASIFDKSVHNWRGAMLNAMLGGLAGGAMAGGSTYLGGKALGAPEPDEGNPYSKRGALGGALGGGAVGAGLGALAASGKVKIPEAVPPLIRKSISALQHGSLKRRLLTGAGVGGLGLGLASAYLGGDEGMQMDFLNRQVAERRRKQLMEDFYSRGEPIDR